MKAEGFWRLSGDPPDMYIIELSVEEVEEILHTDSQDSGYDCFVEIKNALLAVYRTEKSQKST